MALISSIEGPLKTHRDEMLVATLRHTQESSPFYGRVLGGIEITLANAREVLLSLPVLPVNEWQARRSQIRTGSIDGATIGYTRGSTGPAKVFLSTQGENRAMESLLRDAAISPMHTLNLINMAHGAASFENLSPNTVAVPFFLPDIHFEAAAKALERAVFPYSELRKFDAISSSLHMVKQFSYYLMKTRRRLTDFDVHKIIVFSQMLSPRWRARLEDWWKAEVEEVYGSSELRMCNSRRCTDCGYFHLPPTCIGELVDLDGAPIDTQQRIGLLAITVFYPFVQLEPRIRYCAGDIVELADEPCPLWGEPGFKIAGRQEHSARLSRGRTITSAHCFSVVADLPEIATYDEAAISTGDPGYHECGSPQFVLAQDEDGATLHIELRYDPELWPEEASAVRSKIAAGLPMNELAIRLCAPGKLPGQRYFV
jgi:phenylacetate-coenzyme A ligase PaaK-like adenylate-forming protein